MIDAFGKNKQVKMVFWTVFIILAGFILAHVVDPLTVQEILMVITRMG